MKIALIISSNYFKSGIWFYPYYFNKYKLPFTIYAWNRLGITENDVTAFNLPESENKGYLKRFLSYLKYKNFVLGQLKQNEYDRIIISTIPIAIFLAPILFRQYRKKYIIDIRDFSIILYLFKARFKKLVKNAYATVISSNGYKQWLPKDNIYNLVHNFPYDIFSVDEKLKITTHFSFNSPIIIATIGSLRDYKTNKFFLNEFKNKNRFTLSFIGEGPVTSALKNFSLKKKFNNVFFTGAFKKGEEANLLVDANILNLLTGNDLNSKTLVTNRFYLSVILGKPMLVYSDTYQSVLCSQYNLGCIVDRGVDIYPILIEYVKTFNIEIYNKGRQDFINEVQNDSDLLEKTISQFLKL